MTEQTTAAVQGYGRCGYCGNWHGYSPEMCKDMRMSLAGYETVRINGGAIMPTGIDSSYTRLINKLEDLLDIHRAKDTVCEPECFCFSIEELLLREMP